MILDETAIVNALRPSRRANERMKEGRSNPANYRMKKKNNDIRMNNRIHAVEAYFIKWIMSRNAPVQVSNCEKLLMIDPDKIQLIINGNNNTAKHINRLNGVLNE